MPDAATQFTVTAVAESVATAIPDRTLVSQGERRYSYRHIVDRSNRLATYLHSRGLGCHTDRDALAGHQVGQDLLGIYAYNGPEFVEGLLGSFRARVAPFNVNYRYVKNELQYLLADSEVSALLYHAAFAPRVAEIRAELPNLKVLIQIADSSGNELLDGAVDYESIVAENVPAPPVQPSPDDLYVLYTGGTTGMPKGVLWRQHDIFVTSFGGRSLVTSDVVDSYEAIASRAAENPGAKIMVLPPLMHGAAQWVAMSGITMGNTLVFASTVDRLDADEVVRTIEREGVSVVTVVGDAMARPLVAAIEQGKPNIPSLVVGSVVELLSPSIKER